MSKLTAPQRARLEKLASYLEGLPEDYAHFDMRNYVLGRTDSATVLYYAKNNGGVDTCGTAACAVGHGPAAGILVPPRFLSVMAEDITDGWHRYSLLFVGASESDPNYPDGERFEWLFGGGWRWADNHHFGAAARIRYLLEQGEPPENWEMGAHASVALYAPYRIDAKAPA